MIVDCVVRCVYSSAHCVGIRILVVFTRPRWTATVKSLSISCPIPFSLALPPRQINFCGSHHVIVGVTQSIPLQLNYLLARIKFQKAFFCLNDQNKSVLLMANRLVSGLVLGLRWLWEFRGWQSPNWAEERRPSRQRGSIDKFGGPLTSVEDIS